MIQATSQKGRNQILEETLHSICKEDEIFNFGVYADSEIQLSYVQISLCICLLLESKAIDFIVTGCSSGQGMMLACNSFAGVECGYVQNVSDAYLFGRINQGNVISYPLGLNWGWGAELNLKATLQALFCEPMGNGYPKSEAKRKQHDTEKRKEIQMICKRNIIEVLPLLDKDIVQGALSYNIVYDFIMEHGTNEELLKQMKWMREQLEDTPA